MSPRKRHRKSKPSSRPGRKNWLSLIVIFAIALTLYMAALYQQITNKFEYHRWNLPSRVYSDEFPLYRGQNLSLEALRSKLLALNYRPVATAVQAHGEFYQAGNTLQIYLHSFDYPQENFPGYPVLITLEDSRVENLTRLDTKEPLTWARLEPELIASIFDAAMEDRTVVKLEQVPPLLTQAILLIEDERFNQHFGVDPIGIVRAMWVNIKNGGIAQGGSTLTQQLVKNLFLNADRTFIRKFNEMLMALLMELRYSKADILQAYLNEVYLGQRGPASVAGVAEAAMLYFSKDISQLNAAESALLAGMIRSPGYYSPFLNPVRARQRRNFVLKRLLEAGQLDQASYARASETALPQAQNATARSKAPFFIDFVQKQLKTVFPGEELTSEGLRIFTTLDMQQQRAAELAADAWLSKLERDYRYLQDRAKQGQQLENAFISIQPQTGAIRAYVGGRNYQKVQFDHASEARRQPGSSFKPFVYLSALDPALRQPPYTLASVIDDTPLSTRVGGKNWVPQNYDQQHHGPVRLRTALENSYNVATVRLALDIGLEPIIRNARLAGIQSPLEAVPSLALGAFEVTPLELISAYSIFPNQGVRTEPIALRQVVTPDGKVLEKKDLQMKRLFPEDLMDLVNRALAGVIEDGTAQAVRKQGLFMPAAGKTGTSSDYRDAWFVGYTPDLLALSWVGYDDNSPTQRSGSSAALPIWIDFMKRLPQNGKNFIPGPNIVTVMIDKATGLLAKTSCGESTTEYFIAGTEPQLYCDQDH